MKLNVSQAVARVYAEALLDLAEDQGNLAQVVDDLYAVRKLFEEDPDFRSFFASHRIDRGAKRKALDDVFGDRLCRPVLGLLHVLVEKQRELVLDNIVDEFDRYRDLREGRVHVHVTTARPLEEDQRDAIASRLKAATGKQIQLHEKVDPGILGGLVVKIEDKVIDGSVRRRLERLGRALVTSGE